MWAYSYAAGKRREDHLIGSGYLKVLETEPLCVLFSGWLGTKEWESIGGESLGKGYMIHADSMRDGSFSPRSCASDLARGLMQCHSLHWFPCMTNMPNDADFLLEEVGARRGVHVWKLGYSRYRVEDTGGMNTMGVYAGYEYLVAVTTWKGKVD